MIRIFTAKLLGLLPCQILYALVCLKVVLYPEIIVLVIVPLEGMAAVTVHVAIGCRCAAI